MSTETLHVSERIAQLSGSDTAPAGDGRTLAGYAVRWDDVAHVFENGHEYEEQILRGAYVQTAAPKLLFDHGRSPQLGMLPVGKISVSEDDIGLKVAGRLFKNATVAPIVEAAAAGELGLSLRFVVPEGYEKWERRAEKLPLRLVGGMVVREISLTGFPSYTASTVTARTMDEAARDRQWRWVTRTRISREVASL